MIPKDLSCHISISYKYIQLVISYLIVISVLFYISHLSLNFQALASPPTKKELLIGLTLEPPHLDPTESAAAAIGEIVYANVFEGLTRIDQNGKIQPALASHWSIFDNGLTYIFHIRPDVKFHSGLALNADHIKINLDYLISEKSLNPQKHHFQFLKEIIVIDDLTVKLSLSEPFGELLYFLALPSSIIKNPVSKHSHKTQPDGTGPYRLKHWYRGDRILFERTPSYWGEKPYFEFISFHFMNDPIASLAALLSGSIDYFPNYPAAETIERLKKAPNISVSLGYTQGKTLLVLNNGKFPLNREKVRQAFNHAIDQKKIIKEIMYNQAIPIGSHYSPIDEGYIDLTQTHTTDLNKARNLLQEEGIKNLKLKMVLPPPLYARRSGELVALQLQEIGIHIDIEYVEWSEWLSKVFREQNYDLTVIAHVEPHDLDIYARDSYYFGFQDEDYKKIYSSLTQSTIPEERLVLLEQAQKYIAEKSIHVFLFLLPKIAVRQKELHGIWIDAPLPVNDLTKAKWIFKELPL